MNIINASDSRSPILHHLSLKPYSKEIVYKLFSNRLGGYENIVLERHHDIVSHRLYRWSEIADGTSFVPYKTEDGEFFEGHAFGLLINPYHSNVLVLDIDEDNTELLSNLIKIFMTTEDVEAIDIAASSVDKDGKVKGRHLWVKLTKPKNLIEFYNMSPEGTCQGFNRLVIKKQEVVIRVSQKFEKYVPDPQTVIRWERGYTKIGEDTWVKFMSEQLTAPLISVDARFLEERREMRRLSLRLRG